MHRGRYLIPLMLPLLLLLMGASAMQEADPVPIPDGMSRENIVKAIKNAMEYRGWTTGELTRQSIEGILKIRTHMIKVKMDFSGKQVVFSYVDSENMKYREKSGLQFIHPNYTKWTHILGTDIRKNLVSLAR